MTRLLLTLTLLTLGGPVWADTTNYLGNFQCPKGYRSCIDDFESCECTNSMMGWYYSGPKTVAAKEVKREPFNPYSITLDLRYYQCVTLENKIRCTPTQPVGGR